MARAIASILVVYAACGGGQPAPAPAPIENVSAAPSRGIVHVDEFALAAILANDTWDRMVDTVVGVVELRAVESAADENLSQFWLRHRCGAAAEEAAQDRGAIMYRRLLHNAIDYPIACRTQGEHVTCDQRGLAEYDLTIAFVFAPRDGRYYLIGISTVDVGSHPDAMYADYEAALGKQEGC
jgi:hypothetical protein